MTTENNKNEKVEDTKNENKKKDFAVEKISEPQEQNPASLEDDPMAIDEPKDINVSLQNPDQ